MNMPPYFYDAARIFERRAAVDAGKAADVWLFYDVNGDEFYYSSYRAGRDDQKICTISEIDSGDYREFADFDFNEIYAVDFNVLTSVENMLRSLIIFAGLRKRSQTRPRKFAKNFKRQGLKMNKTGAARLTPFCLLIK